MRWRRRDEPWGSHHVDARALKWEISVGLTEDVELKRLREGLRNRRETLRSAVGWRAMMAEIDDLVRYYHTKNSSEAETETWSRI